MNTEEIKHILTKALALQEVHVSGDGRHFNITAVGELFAGMSRLKQQKTIYAPLITHINNNDIHALSIKTYTPIEWQNYRKLNAL